MRHIFIDEDIRVLEGAEAQRHLAERNDLPFLDPASGVVAVSPERWALAQRAEQAHWMRRGIGAQDDRNRQHLLSFRSFEALRGRSFRHALEIGCGPFTNLRLIGRTCKIGRCTLLDPLVRSYLSHPYCYYDERMLDLGPTGVAGRIARKLLPRCYRAAQRAMGRCIPVAALEPAPIETYAPSSRFDLVVMINVLEHCFDGRRVFGNILAACEPGAAFVFMDALYDAAPMADSLARQYDAAHPLKIDRRVLLDFLQSNFDELFSRVVPRHSTRTDAGEHLDWHELFYAGTRKTT